jgi:hypothetical protein
MHSRPHHTDGSAATTRCSQPAVDQSGVLEYLHDEVPWEWERLESLDRLVSSWPDWAAPGSDPCQQTYSSWLRGTYGMFQTPTGLGGAA